MWKRLQNENYNVENDVVQDEGAYHLGFPSGFPLKQLHHDLLFQKFLY